MELQFTEIENIVTNHLDIDLKKNTRAYPYPMSRFMYFKLCRKYGPKIEVGSFIRNIKKRKCSLKFSCW